MDPLGSPLDIVDVAVLKRWQQIAPREPVLTEEDKTGAQNSCYRENTPFPIDEELNRKIALWVGDLTSLNAHAIVNSTNENLTDRSPLSQRLVARAGPQMRQDMLSEIQSCRTGEAKLSKGYNLPARFVIHTVGPKYNVKFHTAAETALHSSYWRVLQMLPEHGLRTLGLCPIHSVRRSYPTQEGAHLALRTIRRFLESHGEAVELIVLAVEGGEVGTYEQLLPLYFPRTTLEEEAAQRRLPKDIGGPHGEPMLPERGIRIVDKPFGAGQQKVSVRLGREAPSAKSDEPPSHGSRRTEKVAWLTVCCPEEYLTAPDAARENLWGVPAPGATVNIRFRVRESNVTPLSHHSRQQRRADMSGHENGRKGGKARAKAAG
ncbi:hypothetical protein HPB51_002549 [Rhipicephalus microplus]|uniref:Macro domain-containing protein n=1 Tax=Rhipicephalus microplus TaxID=6941 RepID=A0A9J6DF60_RHIMP|nr:hypothetical protein HPB51_002549 [Rhipicephalus microplus]